MTITARLCLEFSSVATAKRIACSLEPDNKDYITVRVVGNVIEATATSITARSLRHTLDDFLACLSLVERTGEGLI
jgi:hypothetical protein